MAATTHRYEIFVNAPCERVWDALTDPQLTVRYFHHTRFESAGTPGAPYRYVLDRSGEPAVEGTIETFDPPRRLVMTWRVLYDDEMSEEPPSRVEWTLTPANDEGSVTRVTLRHGDLALSPKTWANVRLGWVQVIDGMKTLLETGAPLGSVDLPEREEPEDVETGWHRAQAVEANNLAWALLDGRTHSADEADDLLQRAYAAAFHWRRAAGATAVNRARAAWLVSHAHAVLGQGDLALHHADRCAALTADADDAVDFDHAYSYEARARALAAMGRLEEAAESYRRAAAAEIADDQDRSIFEGDLRSGPWFGLEVAGAP